MAIALLVRHGRTTANTSGVLAGWTPGIELDDAGQQQVNRLAARLADLPIAAVVASPLIRCQQTAAALVGRLGVPLRTEESLGECHYGAWTGRKISELVKDPLWRQVQDQPSAVTFPPSAEYDNESMRAMQDRAVATIRRLDAEFEAATGPRTLWVAVSHGDVIKAILSDAAGAHLDSFQRISVNPASVSVVQYTSRRPFVLRVNDNGPDLSDLRPVAEAGAAGAAADGDATPGGSVGGADPSGLDTASDIAETQQA